MAEQQTSLEQRLRAIEDRLEIYNLIASHPPSADTGTAAYAEAVYTEDGVFDRGPELVRRHRQQGDRRRCSKATATRPRSPAASRISPGCRMSRSTATTAVVISYLQILTPKKSGEPVEVPNHGASRGYHIHRVVTNRWDLERTPSGWKIKRRTIRLVDGSEPSREILRGALKAYA